MDAAETLRLALSDADRQLRADRPDWFVKVDEIKARPGWKPFDLDPKGQRVGQKSERGVPFPTGFRDFLDNA